MRSQHKIVMRKTACLRLAHYIDYQEHLRAIMFLRGSYSKHNYKVPLFLVFRKQMSNLTTTVPSDNLWTKNFTLQFNSTQVSPESLKDFKNSFLVIILLLNIIGNIGVIVTVIHDRELRSSPRNVVLASLALSDVLMAIVIAFRIWVLYDQTVSTTCVVFTALFSVFIYVSVLHLFTLSIDSYVAVFYPLKYRTIITIKRLAVVITTVWVLPATVMTFLPIYLKGQHEFYLQSIFPHCVGSNDINVDQSYEILTYVQVCIFFIIPMLCMIWIYLKIAKVSWYQSNRVSALDKGSAVHPGRSRAREMKWAKTIGIRTLMIKNVFRDFSSFNHIMIFTENASRFRHSFSPILVLDHTSCSSVQFEEHLWRDFFIQSVISQTALSLSHFHQN